MSRIWKFGDSINTDDILPGKYAPFMVGEDNFQNYAFAHLRPDFAKYVKAGDILIGGNNWGLGSSREYAPRALKKLQIAAVIAKSFARIHYRNLLNLGIPTFISEQAYGMFEDGDSVSLELEKGLISCGEKELGLEPPAIILREALRAGSVLDYYKKYKKYPGEV